jgi:hypothetical protein
MPYRSSQYDDDFENEAWDEDDSDEDDDDEKSTVPCPYCRQPVYDDAQYCTNCEEFISLEDATPERKPLWIVATAIFCLSSGVLWYLLTKL